MKNRLKRLFFDRSGLWLAVSSVLFVIAWRGWVVAHKSAHIQEMADELGSIGEFQHLDNRLYPNHSNTYLVFGQYTENGVGIFFCDTTDGKKKLVCEQPEKGWRGWLNFGMLGWSPDDRFFACAFPPNDPRQPQQEIIIYNGDTGEAVITLGAGNNKLTDFAWLTSDSFVYAFSDGNNHYGTVIKQKPDGNWVQASNFRKLGNEEMTGLVATSSHSIAWQQGTSLWTLDFVDGTPQKIWESSTNQLHSFTYSEKDGLFYMTCGDETHWFQICFRPPTGLNPQGIVLDYPELTDDKANDATLRNESGLIIFYVKAAHNSEWKRFPLQGQIQNYQVNGDCLYITGDLTNQPPGIWKYDFNSGECAYIISALDYPLKYAQLVYALSGTSTNSVGHLAHYQIWQPTHFEAGKKYPLVIGQTPYLGWVPYPQIAANGGCYFLLVERPSWSAGLNDWSEDVMTAYDLMAKNPNVDTNHVYLFGASAETALLSQLLAEKTDLWRGAILFNPTLIPDPSAVRICKLLILDGTDDSDAVKEWIDYQNKAAQEGITVNLALVNGAQHIFKSTASEREKTRQLARFLFGD